MTGCTLYYPPADALLPHQNKLTRSYVLQEIHLNNVSNAETWIRLIMWQNMFAWSWYFVDRASQYSLFFFISNLIHYSLTSTYSICYPLSSTCFRPHRPIIMRSKLYMQPMVFSPSTDVFVVWPLRKNSFSTATRQRHLQRGRVPQAACTI